MTAILALLAIGLSIFDAWFTRRRLHKYGLHVELNAGIIQLAFFLGGLTRAVIVMTVLPTVLIAGVLTYFNWTLLMAFYLGMRMQLLKNQLDSIEVERYIDLARGVVTPSSGPTEPPEDKS